MARGKHSSDSGYSFESKFEQEMDYGYEEDESVITKRKIIIILSIVAVILVAILVAYLITSKDEEIPTNVEENDTAIQEENDMIETVAGYDVLGKIIIEDIGVEQYILDSTEDTALEKGVGKLYGGTLNNYGNFCIAGHNYENVFQKLSEMEVGDNFIIVDTDLSETTYQIKEIFSAEPDDLKCLLQNDEKVEITLVTCENGATTRLIVKAEELLNANINNTTTEDNTNTVSDAKENG